MNKRFIIGLGTGRCGTMSLAYLLSAQNGLTVPHEYLDTPLPWSFSIDAIENKLHDLRRLNGDVGFYYLNYVEYIQQQFSDARFVCLQREKEEVIDSYLRKTMGRNHWMDHDGGCWKQDQKWDLAYPNFSTQSKEEALSLYYDSYYAEISRLKNIRDIKIELFSVDDLNNCDGVERILRFCGFKDDEMNIHTSIRVNVNTR